VNTLIQLYGIQSGISLDLNISSHTQNKPSLRHILTNLGRFVLKTSYNYGWNNYFIFENETISL
jgi:hypothetical protein